jgi:hypothetical protein
MKIVKNKLSPEEIKSHICALLSSGVGFNIELFGMLSIDELEDGRYRIFSEIEEFISEDVSVAVDKFLDERQKRELGYDREINLGG